MTTYERILFFLFIRNMLLLLKLIQVVEKKWYIFRRLNNLDLLWIPIQILFDSRNITRALISLIFVII